MATLGICIPTYKRPEFLRRCVFSALEAAGDCPVRIFIADDSLDETNSALFAELQARCDTIVVDRNMVNLGIDDNIQHAVDMCDCDYAWIVGEDDYFLPGSIQRVHALLQNTSASFVFANYVYVGDNEGRVLGCALDNPPTRMPYIEFIARHLWAAGFIGACIINRHRWRDTSTVLYKGTYYTHVGRICELLSCCSNFVHIVIEPCVANRVEGTDTFTWKRDSYGVFFGFRAMCAAVAMQCPDLRDPMLRAAQVMSERYGWLTLRLAIRLRSEKGYDLAQYRRYLLPNISSPIKRMAFLLISIAPSLTLRPLVATYRYLLRVGSP